MIKSFIAKQVMRKQLSQIPKEKRDKIEALVEENPELFVELARDVQKEMESGKDQATALMAVAERNKDKLKGIL